MSYDIVYTKQFIKTEEGKIIPLVLIGSNNCYSVNVDSRGRRYERRARDWNAIYTNGQNQNIALKPDELMDRIKKYTGGSYEEHFKTNGRYLDDKGLIRFFENGIKNAKTIEELSELNAFPIALRAGFSIWYKTGEKYSNGSFKENNKFENYEYISTSQELTEFLNYADERIRAKSDSENVYVSLQFTDEKAIPYPKNKKHRKKKEKPEEYWTIMTDDNLYLKRLTKNAAKLSYYKSDSKWFPTQNATEKYIDKYRLNSRFSGKRKFSAVFIKKDN